MGRIKEWLLAEMDAVHDEPMWDYDVSFLCPICGQPAAGYMASNESDTNLVDDIPCSNSEEDHSFTVIIDRSKMHVRARLEGHTGVPVNVSQQTCRMDGTN